MLYKLTDWCPLFPAYPSPSSVRLQNLHRKAFVEFQVKVDDDPAKMIAGFAEIVTVGG
jgi:hypothetical protein